MNIETYKQYWHDVHETLYTYSYSQLANAPIDHETFVFLTSWGLPSATAPFVTFTEITQPYFVTINDFFDISFPKLQNYWVFGTNGSGDPICIDTQKKYEIVYLNHDNHYQRIFINNSITQFAFCLIKYRNFIAAIIDNTAESYARRKFSIEEFSQLKNDMLAIDDNCLVDDSFWNEEMKYLWWEREND